MSTLVTGAAGFIGFHVASHLLRRGDEVIALDNLNNYYDISLKQARLEQLQNAGNFVFHKGTVETEGLISSLCSEHRVQRIVHLAAQAGVRHSISNPRVYLEGNVLGFLNVLEAAHDTNVDRLIYASSSSVYGDSSLVPFATDARVDKPLSMYAVSKIADELMAHVFHHQYGLSVTGLRFFTVYGPWGRPDMSPSVFLERMLKGETIQLFNHGKHRRDFTYVDDVVEGILRVHDAVVNKEEARVYNIGRGAPIGLLDFVGLLEELLGRPAEKELLPLQPGDVEETYADVSELQRDFGYRPQTSLKEGLAQFVNWYRKYYQV